MELVDGHACSASRSRGDTIPGLQGVMREVLDSALER